MQKERYVGYCLGICEVTFKPSYQKFLRAFLKNPFFAMKLASTVVKWFPWPHHMADGMRLQIGMLPQGTHRIIMGYGRI